MNDKQAEQQYARGIIAAEQNNIETDNEQHAILSKLLASWCDKNNLPVMCAMQLHHTLQGVLRTTEQRERAHELIEQLEWLEAFTTLWDSES